MRCAWNELLAILPPWMRGDVDKAGAGNLQELRLRVGLSPELCFSGGSMYLDRPAEPEDLDFVVNTASKYSPWSTASAGRGYLCAQGAHRIGLCGEAVIQGGEMKGIRRVTSLCIRVARDFPGIAKAVDPMGSVLIAGSPGSGKTTLLRDLIRQRSALGQGSVGVVDERGELFPSGCFPAGPRTDVLTGCGKPHGIEVLLKTMGPACIAVDEITAEADCDALMEAGWCGVHVYATVHASGKEDLLSRRIYRKLVESRVFDTLLVMQSDKTWRRERINL
jgi:stage III sporulation protein AA